MSKRRIRKVRHVLGKQGKDYFDPYIATNREMNAREERRFGYVVGSTLRRGDTERP